MIPLRLKKDKMYDIITYCSENYKNCFEFSIKSWIESDVRKIYVYTDGWSDESLSEKLVFVNISEKTDDWVKNVGKKIMCVNHYWNLLDSVDCFCFLDMDNYITAPFGEVFDSIQSVGLTRIDLPHKTVSAGNVFIRKNEISRKFVDAWESLQTEHQSTKSYHNGYRGVAHDQTSLHDLTWEDLRGSNQYKITSLASHTYNSEAGRETDHLMKVRDHKSKIIHFKDHRWKNPGFVNAMMTIISQF